MKTWQKITGLIILASLLIYELLIWANAYVDLKYIIEPSFLEDVVDCAYLRIGSLSVAMWLNFVLALILFICLWRKENRHE
ncbi:MAG: hypothetical protein LKF33_07925 [Prevotella sp.]|jgi:hypothetical protein|nr:hypothetical protein [Prevotella sp.]